MMQVNRKHAVRTVNQRTQEWLEWMLTTSVPLVRLDADGMPLGIASGCFVDYGDRRFLLSVKHAIAPGSKDWVVILDSATDAGTAYYRPKEFNYIGEMVRGSATLRTIDLCYAEIPRDLVAVYKNSTLRGYTDERSRHVFSTELSDAPDPAQIYAFAGQVKPEMHASIAFATEMVVYPGLRYLRSEGESDVFALPVEHPGHVDFKGCSGAPIVDMNRTVVAVLSDGNTSTNTVRGVSVSRCKPALDFITGRSKAQHPQKTSK